MGLTNSFCQATSHAVHQSCLYNNSRDSNAKTKKCFFPIFFIPGTPSPSPLKTLGGGVVWRVRAGNFCHCEHTPHPLATTHPIKFAAYNTIVDYWIGKLKTFYFDDYCLLVLAYYNKSLIFAYLYLNLYFLKNDNIIIVTA
jgi:hypothetical protein